MKLTALKSGLFCLSLMSVASVSAKVLTVIHANGTTQVDITRIDRIHFDSGNMNIEHSNGTHQIPLSDIENIGRQRHLDSRGAHCFFRFGRRNRYRR